MPTLGPDGTGVGHILWYTLDAPEMDLGEQRAVQDWYVKFALLNVKGVSEVSYFGFGASAFYRYGPYQLPTLDDNLVYRINFDFSF